MPNLINIHNPFTGLNSAGPRFRFQVNTISHHNLYLPYEMRDIPQIQNLIRGKSPCLVFGSDSIEEARIAFRKLRMKFDFPFWAATSFLIRDCKDPLATVPLCLNYKQNLIIHLFRLAFLKRDFARFIISKSGGPIGLTTVLHAYIIWLQLFSDFHGKAVVCGPSDANLQHLRLNMARNLDCKVDQSKKILRFSNDKCSVLFNSCLNPDATRSMDISFALLADMSKWYDSDGFKAQRTFQAHTSGILINHYDLVVLEGNRPADFFDNANLSPNLFIEKYPKEKNKFFLKELKHHFDCRFSNSHFKLIDIPQ